ncbi:hypothetical protein ACTXT7_016072 [Hymenolepis weldensis]
MFEIVQLGLRFWGKWVPCSLLETKTNETISVMITASNQSEVLKGKKTPKNTNEWTHSATLRTYNLECINN